MSTLHDFSLHGLNGAATINLADYAGRKVLLVNTASACGYTPQYTQLEELHQHYGNKVAVVACPCNQFGAQEAGSEQDIAQFCEVRYGVSFPLSEKIAVKGTDAHPLYKWATDVSQTEVSWNFQKYLFDEQGRFVQMFSPGTSPLDETLLAQIGV